MAAKKLDKQMIANIKNYGEEIKSLASLVDVIRKTPSRFIGGMNNKGHLNCTREIVQNGFDQIMRPDSPADRLFITYDARTLTCIVEDNGTGIPFDKIIKVFTDDKTSSNYEKKDGFYTAGAHGTGSTICNALCSSFVVESFILGEAKKVEFNNFFPTTEKPVDIDNEGGKQGTRITFKPAEALGDITTSEKDVSHLLRTLMPLTKLGTIVEYSSIDMDGNLGKEKFVNRDGILSILINNTNRPLLKPISIQADTGKIRTNILFTFDTDEDAVETVTSYSNFCYTVYGGTHVKGFEEGVRKFFKEYMNKIFLAGNKKKLTVTNADISAGIKAVVDISLLYPKFSSQSKDALENSELVPYLTQLVYDTLQSWSKKNPNELQKVCKYLKSMAELRLKLDATKVKMNKYKPSKITGLPSKFEAPSDMSSDDLELIIVEGDSAGGTAKVKRAPNQGVFPIRGKLSNAFGTTKAKMLNNSEVQAIITILGCGYGKSFDISKCKYKKIIILADGDSDGAHISVLLLSLFLLYMPGLIQEGRLYKGTPPLYGIPIRGKKMKYFTNKREYVSYIQGLFSKEYTVENFNKNKLSKHEVLELLYKNDEYLYNINTIANRYAVDPRLLEMVLYHGSRVKNIKELHKLLKKEYRFIEAKKEKGNLLVEGLIGDKYNFLYLDKRFSKESEEIIRYMQQVNHGELYYYVNGEYLSMYHIMKKFEDLTPKGLQRYKGLGEMDEDQLAESALRPEGNRTLIRYTLENAKQTVEEIRVLQSDKSKLLPMIGKVSRSELY